MLRNVEKLFLLDTLSPALSEGEYLTKKLPLLPPSEVCLLPFFFFCFHLPILFSYFCVKSYVPNTVKHSLPSLIHLLLWKTLQKDGIGHFIFLSFVLFQNEVDTMPD